MQMVPLKLLEPHETKELTLDLLKHTNVNDQKDTKKRGKIVLELTYVPFKEDSTLSFNAASEKYGRLESGISNSFNEDILSGAGVLSVLIQAAKDVEGERHNNPYALVIFRGEKKKTKASNLYTLSFPFYLFFQKRHPIL